MTSLSPSSMAVTRPLTGGSDFRAEETRVSNSSRRRPSLLAERSIAPFRKWNAFRIGAMLWRIAVHPKVRPWFDFEAIGTWLARNVARSEEHTSELQSH